jgi:hypothetical protein
MDGSAATPHPDYTDAWNDLYLRRVILIGLSVGFLPAVAFLCFVVTTFSRTAHGGEDAVCGPIAILWLVALFIAAIRANLFRCPRCRQFFCNPWGGRWIFATKCPHCGIRMGDNSSWPND